MLRAAFRIVIGLLLLPTNAIAQQKAELMIGWLGCSDGMISQVLAIKNNDARTIRIATVKCNFSRDEKPFAVGSVDIDNIDPTAAGYGKISIKSANPSDEATCRIRSVKWVRNANRMSSAFLRGDMPRRTYSPQGWQIHEPVNLYR